MESNSLAIIQLEAECNGIKQFSEQSIPKNIEELPRKMIKTRLIQTASHHRRLI